MIKNQEDFSIKMDFICFFQKYFKRGQLLQPTSFS